MGYDGQGGVVRVTVGIDPTSAHARDMVQPVRNALTTLNALQPTTGNLVLARNSNVPGSSFDFESVALHELGHALGLDHPSLGRGCGGDKDSTNAKKGPNPDSQYDLGAGDDGVFGSKDDQRGDDDNVHWFFRETNNPFVQSAGANRNTDADVVDETTYSRNRADLPDGHEFAANGNRKVAETLGFKNTETVMHWLVNSGEIRRELTLDDIATLRYAMSGLDEESNTHDDYTIGLEFNGMTTNADVVLRFDESYFLNKPTLRAQTSAHGRYLDDAKRHVAITTARIYFSDDDNWSFGVGVQ